jgi:predicted GNAT family acetyltransferase
MDFIIEQNRIYKHDGQGKILAQILFPDKGEDKVAITHVFVDISMREQGIADQLMSAALDELQARGKRIEAVCSYAIKWFEYHPEYHNLL